MEAIGKFDFTATAGDELSFKKGETIKILGTKDNWFRAEKHGMQGFVPRNYITIDIPSWYREDMSRHMAESILIPQPTGAFVIRGSQSSPGNFSISVRHDMDVQHFKVLQDSRGQYFLWTEKFSSLNELVDYYTVNSISRNSPVRLLTDQRGPLNVNPVPGPRPQNMFSAPAASCPHPQERGQRTTDRQGRSFPPPAAPRPMETLPPAQSSLFQVKALYRFEAEEKDELEFNAGDIIEVLEQSESFWWKGRLRGRTGLFPSNYITNL